TTEVVPTLCASHGEYAISGGAKVNKDDATLVASYPSGVAEVVPVGTPGDEEGRWGARGWSVKVTAGDSAVLVHPYVVCANIAVQPTQ
ncbi:MAG: hypothetical protein ACRDQA_12130, partial [Nocardioidaceae bacterium]